MRNHFDRRAARDIGVEPDPVPHAPLDAAVEFLRRQRAGLPMACDSVDLPELRGLRPAHLNHRHHRGAAEPEQPVDARLLSHDTDTGGLPPALPVGSEAVDQPSGADMQDLLYAAQHREGLRPQVVRFMHRIAHAAKPVVAAVQGVAVGIGTTMLLHCDYVVAGSNATFATPFSRLGLIPEAGSSLLAPLRMGHARAFALLAMGRPLTAAAAKEAGIVNEVVDPATVDEVALKAAQDIATLPPGAIAVSRRLLRGELDDVVERINTEVALFRERLQSDEARAAFTAFLSRKK